MIRIELYHYRNCKSFKRYFHNAKFEGFECGYYFPSWFVGEQEWEANKGKLPKSCTITKIEKVEDEVCQ
jgi:hypothetical protein